MNENKIEKARRLRAVIEMASQLIPEREGSEAPELFPAMKYDGTAIQAGTRIRWGDKVMTAQVTLWDLPESSPDASPTLWKEIAYRQGIRIIPAVISAADAFSKGEQGWWSDEVYTSLIDANVWTPDTYPQGWEKVQA